MKKNILIILLLLIMVSLVGCHKATGAIKYEIPNSFDDTRDYEITFWAKHDSNNYQKAIYDNAAKSFNEIYPNIKVNIQYYDDYGKIYNDVITNIATKTTPNVCISYPDHVATYLEGENIIVPLNDFFTDKKYGFGGSEIKFDGVLEDEIVPKYLQECFFDDNYYSLPYMRSTEACYINKTYIEALGFRIPSVLTWDFVWEVSEKAMEEKVDGQVLIPFIYKSTDNMMIQSLKQKNASYSSSKGEVFLFNDTTKEILKTIGVHGESRAFSTFKIDSYPGNFFNAGQCLFAIDSTAGSTWIGSNAPLMEIPKEQVQSFTTEVMMIPQYDTENPQMISQGPSLCIFNKEDTNEVLASWLFTQYLLTNDVQIKYSQTEGYIPVTTKAQTNEEYLDYLSKAGIDNKEHYDVKIKATKLLLDNIDNTFVTPVFNGSTSLRNAAGQLIENVVRSARKKVQITDEYLEEQFDSVSSLYRLSEIKVEEIKELNPSDLGPIPKQSKVFLICLGTIWVLIIGYVTVLYVKKRKLEER